MSAPAAPTLLAFDAAGAGCAAVLWRAGRVIARRREPQARGQAERLVPMLDALLAEAGVGYDALDAIAVTTGPGGFTGVRLGLAAARGLALACDSPVVGVSVFEAIAAAAAAERPAGTTLVVLVDARRTDLHVQVIDSEGEPAGAPFAAGPAALDRHLPPGALALAGDGAAAAAAPLRAAGRSVHLAPQTATDPAWVAHLAAGRIDPAAPPPRPLYLRPPDTTPAAAGG